MTASSVHAIDFPAHCFLFSQTPGQVCSSVWPCKMNQSPLSTAESTHQILSSLPSHIHFPHRLSPVPEHEMGSYGNTSPDQQPLSSLRALTHKGQFLQNRSFSPSRTPTSANISIAWSANEMQKPVDHNLQRRMHLWTMSVHLTLHLVSFAASVAIVVLLAQALMSHQNLRHVRQFSGADNAWPKPMSLSASILLLSVAGMNIVKSATFLVVGACCNTRRHKNTFFIVMIACSALLAAAWIPAIVFLETNRQDDNNFATWACARSDAAINAVVPYGAICSEEVCQIFDLEVVTID
jgi:hypothetical protein